MRLGSARLPSVGIEALNLYALLREAEARSGAMGDEQDLAAFVDAVKTGLAESLGDQRRLHGRWVQDLFKMVVVSLDGVRMIKGEDDRAFYFDRSGPPLGLPDYRVVCRDGEQLLVEVKNVAPSRTLRTQRLRVRDVEAEREYAALTGARLVFAHYWAAANLWTMVDSRALCRDGKHYTLGLSGAMVANELGRLGDRVVITPARLALSLASDPAAPAVPAGAAGEENGMVFRVGKAELTCNGRVLTDPVERRIASYLFYFGAGEATFEGEVDDGGQPVRIDIVSSAPCGSENPNVGTPLSSIYSARYILATKQPDGTITRFGYGPDPRLARLVPADYWDRKDRVLPLIVAHMRSSATIPPKVQAS